MSALWLMTANPVTGRAEEQQRVAVFTSRERAMAYARASRLPAVETVNGFHLTFREGSLLRWFNGYSIGDWHAPESVSAYHAVNPCLFDVQLHELQPDVTVEDVVTRGLRVDPELPEVAA